MSREMVISANPHETRVAILEDGQLCEYYVEREKEFALVGSIYKGRVTRVLPGMQSAFVDIGLDSDAFLYVTDFLEGVEEFEPIVATVEEKTQKMQEQGGGVFPNGGTNAVTEAPEIESREAPLQGPPSSTAEEVPAQGGAPVSSGPASPSRSDSTAPGREHFEGRHRRGREFGRRGRGGRFGRRGGRGGHRHGRELPPSKYAPPGAYEEQSNEGESPRQYVPVILPGESLARFKDLASPPAVASAPAAEGQSASDSVGTEAPTVSAEVATAGEVPAEAAIHEHSSSRREEPSRPVHGELEPLPGETLSKWNHQAPAVEEHSESAGVSTAPLTRGLDETENDHPDSGAEAESEEHLSAISEDEAAALAEHVLEAQSEAAEQEEDRAEAHASDDLTEEQDVELAEGETASFEHEENVISGEETREAEDTTSAEAESSSEAEAASSEEEAQGDERPPASEKQPWTARVRDDFRARMHHPARRDRGRRDERGRRRGGRGHHRPQQRRPQLIADLLKQGQEIIVQIAKEPLGKKGARITSHIALPGRYLVYMPTLDHSGVSRKIASAEERSRLRHLVNEAKGNAGGGFIVRTAAATAAPEDLRADVEFLTRTWSEIKSRSEQRKAPSLLHRDLNLVERILRDHVNSDYTAIWVDSEETYTKVIEFMGHFQSGLVNRVKLYSKDAPIFEEFGIQQEIDKALRPKVWLKSGGYIVINHTEALVAIDVNTGKFVGKGSTRLEDTIVRTNLEAVKEVVRQMRLRDLGGIIVIDFIDMEDRRNREKVMAALEEALRADRAPSKMLRFNEFGLIAITRKRTKQALERTLCQPCPYCTGSGMVKSIPTLCYEIQSEARKMAAEIDSGSLTLRVHPEISKAFKTRESSLIEEFERVTRKSIIIQADPTLHWEQYDIY